jgi:hypothetical protein
MQLTISLEMSSKTLLLVKSTLLSTTSPFRFWPRPIFPSSSSPKSTWISFDSPSGFRVDFVLASSNWKNFWSGLTGTLGCVWSVWRGFRSVMRFVTGPVNIRDEGETERRRDGETRKRRRKTFVSSHMERKVAVDIPNNALPIPSCTYELSTIKTSRKCLNWFTVT